MQRKLIPMILLAAIFALGGCGGHSGDVAKVDGLDGLGMVRVVSREEGSGTRSSFADMLGFGKSGSDTDETCDDAVIVRDAKSVIDEVSGDSAAIGYASMGTSLPTGVKALAVNGVDSVVENVVKGDYSLSRPFCLVWTGELSDAELDFMTYVMGKGQAIVGKSYAPVHNAVYFLSDMSGGTITIHGSTSVAPVMEELAEEYETLNPNVSIMITTSDSTTGINDALQGLCDIGMASRELKDYESELLECRVIAYDGIAVVVNSENPLGNVTEDELKALFTGEITTWKEINERRN